jgi:hypothetical protein
MRDYWRGDTSNLLVFVGKQEREAIIEFISISFLRMTVHRATATDPSPMA